jgi:galactose mutarotase-like enzyme
MYFLENEKLIVQISDVGAELCSVLDKDLGMERIHDANPKVWNRHAPILFPFVGKVTDDVYRIGQKEYLMNTQHGFARDMKFICVEKTDRKIVHRLEANEETKKNYPFDFCLDVTHELEAKNPKVLKITWEIRNQGEETMYYFIGGHPGFTTVEKDPAAKEEYYLAFEGKKEIVYFGVNKESGFAAPKETKKVLLENGKMKFHPDIYETLIFDAPEFTKVSIVRPNQKPHITMECTGFTSFGIWTKPEADYICLEPWMGRTDDHGFTGTIEEKTGVQILKGKESRSICHTIEFHG